MNIKAVQSIHFGQVDKTLQTLASQPGAITFYQARQSYPGQIEMDEFIRDVSQLQETGDAQVQGGPPPRFFATSQGREKVQQKGKKGH